jgi:Hg(II)-responsive transcriptional regulator
MTIDRLTIGQLARKARVNIETIRYYERRGLLPRPRRAVSGYRQYSSEHVAHVSFIKRAQRLGFSLKEIAELLSLKLRPGTTCSDVRTKAETKIVEINRRITNLQIMLATLTHLTTCCREDIPATACPILDALSRLDGEAAALDD